jgi:hypothetical protein
VVLGLDMRFLGRKWQKINPKRQATCAVTRRVKASFYRIQ